MTQKQVDYTMKRLDEIKREKRDFIELSYRVEGKTLKKEEMYDLIASKKVVLRPKKEAMEKAQYNSYVDYFFDFSKHKWESYKKEGYEKKIEELNKKVTKIKDELILGDSEEAMKLLKDLENFK